MHFHLFFQKERKAFAAIALTTDTSILTAVSNDYGFQSVFSRQVEGLGVRGDVLIGISTSGNSENVLHAVRTAKSMGLITLGFAGKQGGKLKDEVDICFCAEAARTSVAQEVHITAFHAICEIVES